MRDSFKRKVRIALDNWRWRCETEEGMLLLLELMLKKQNGYYNSHTEQGFLDEMKVLTKSGTPNKLGREFMVYMLYSSCNNRPPAFDLMHKYRN